MGDLVVAFKAWGFDERGWSVKTQSDYGYRVRAANRWFETQDEKLADVTSVRLKAYVFSTKASAVNRNRIRAALIGWYDFCIAQELRPDNPARELVRLPERQGLPRPLTHDEVRRLLEASRTYSPLFACVVELKLHTGLRISELLALKWSEVRGDWLELIQKGGQIRTVHLTSTARSALHVWASQQTPDRWVFPSPRLVDRPVSRNWIERKLAELGTEAEIEHMHPHRLRHTFGTAVYRGTGDLGIAQKALGHKSITSTAVYALVRPPEVAEAMERIRY